MASPKTMVKFVNDIPHTAIMSMAHIMDVPGPNNWETLAGLMGFSMEKVRVLGLALQRNSSPFKDMIRVWGYKNHTVSELFMLLHKMNHVRCMEILKPYVDARNKDLLSSQQESTGPPYPEDNDSNGGGGGSSHCQLQRQSSTQYSHQAFVDRRGIDPENLPTPVPPPLECTCGNCSSEECYNSFVPPSSSRLSSPLSSRLHTQSSRPPKPSLKASQSSPLPINTDNINLDSKDPKQGSSFGSVSTTSCNLSTGTLAESTDKVLELKDYLGDTSIDSELLETLQSQDMKEIKEMTPQEKKQRMQMYALAAMNHKKYKEIVSGTDNFNQSNLLGEGAFGKVYRAMLNETPFAVKRLIQSDPADSEAAKHEKIARKYQVNEIVALLKYRHINIVPLCFYSLDGPEPCLVYEFMHHGSLQDKLVGKKLKNPLQWRLRLKIAMGSARGIQFLHNAMDKPLIHGDIKSANILLDKHSEPKIGDFGLAREGPKDCKSYTILKTEAIHGTINYLPPEFLRSWKLSTKVDSFSFGVVLYEIVTGQLAFEKSKQPPFKVLMQVVEGLEDQDDRTIVQKLRDPRCPDWPEEVVIDFVKIARKCTMDKPKTRPEVKEVLDDLVRLDVKVQTMRDVQLGKQPVQNTEPYQVQNSNRGECEAQPANQNKDPSPTVPGQVLDKGLPVRVPGEHSEEPSQREYEESPETESPQQQSPVESQPPDMTLEEKAALKQREIEGEALAPDMTLEEKAALKQREIEGVEPRQDVDVPEQLVPDEMTCRQREIEMRLTPTNLEGIKALTIGANAPRQEDEIERVTVNKKGTDTPPQDSGRYSGAAIDPASMECHRSASEGYASTATDDTPISSIPAKYGAHQLQLQHHAEFFPPTQQQRQLNSYRQGCPGNISPEPVHRVPTEPCESTDYTLSSPHGDKRSTQSPEMHPRINEERLRRMQPERFDFYRQTAQEYQHQDYRREEVRYQQSQYPIQFSTPTPTPAHNYRQHPPANPPIQRPTVYPPPSQPVQGPVHSPLSYQLPNHHMQSPVLYPPASSQARMWDERMCPPQGAHPHPPHYGAQFPLRYPAPNYVQHTIQFDDNCGMPMEVPYGYFPDPHYEENAFINDQLPGDRQFQYYPPMTHGHPNFPNGQQQKYVHSEVRYNQQPLMDDERNKPRRKKLGPYTPQKPANNMQNTKVSQNRTVTGSPQGNVTPTQRDSPKHHMLPTPPPDSYQQNMMPQHRDLQQQVFQNPGLNPAPVHRYSPSAQGMAPGSFQGIDSREMYNPQYSRMDVYQEDYHGHLGHDGGQGNQGPYFPQRHAPSEDPTEHGNLEQMPSDHQPRLMLGRSAEISNC